MNLTLLWKEWREQRLILAAISAFAILALVFSAQVFDASSSGNALSPREYVPFGLVCLAGIVCGAILLADEKEVGTLEFLDTLPTYRWRLWLSKCAFGLMAATCMGLLFAVISIYLGCYNAEFSNDPDTAKTISVLLMVVVAISSFVWGMFGGALAKTTLGAIVQGCIFGFLCMLVITLVGTVIGVAFRIRTNTSLVVLVQMIAWISAGFFGSLWIFSRPDRRHPPELEEEQFLRKITATEEKQPESKPSLYLRLRRMIRRRLVKEWASLWIALKQSKWLAIGLGVAGVVAGTIFLVPDAQPALAWPQWTLCMGVLAGVLALGEEQTKGVARFWAERRLPLGRFWFTKLAVYFTIALLACTISFMISLIGRSQSPFHSSVFLIVRPHFFMYVMLGLVYGFAFGHFCSLFFRKSIVTSLVAVILAATLAGLILPSLINGGLERWQVWGTPFLLLLLSRMLLYPWANGRILQRGPVLRAVAGIGGVIVLTMASIGYRILQVPNEPDHLAESGFAESIPPFDENETGRLFRSAINQFQLVSKESNALYPRRKQEGLVSTDSEERNILADPINKVLRGGWTEESSELKPWLDEMFSKPWLGLLKDGASRPMGVVEDPHDLDRTMTRENLQGTHELINAVRVRGLQRQAEGHPEEYLELLRQSLALVRSLKNKGDSPAYARAIHSEESLLTGLWEWTKKVDRGELFVRATAIVAEHDRLVLKIDNETFWADQMVLRNTFDKISNWLPPHLTRFGVPVRNAETEAEIITFAWNVPWERLRRERIIRRISNPENTVGIDLVSPLLLMPPLDVNRIVGYSPARGSRLSTFVNPGLMAARTYEKEVVATRQFYLIALALRAFESKKGSMPASLNELVPDFLSSIPLDPFSNKPFGYRVSPGESITMPGLANLDSSKNKKHLDIEDLPMLEMVMGLSGFHSGLPLFPLWKMHESYDPRAWGGGLVLDASLPPGVDKGPHSLLLVIGEERTVEVRAGQAILWSTGRDGIDDGGKRGSTSGRSNTSPGEDWIFILPPSSLPKR